MSSVRDRVTGRLRYIADLVGSDLLHVAFVRIPRPHVRIAGIDTSEADALPGVVDVITGDDLAADHGGEVPRYGTLEADQPVIAQGVARYEGEPVAIVVARDERTAREAVRLVRVDYEELSPIMTREASLSSPPLHQTRPPSQRRWEGTNVMGEWTFTQGDVDDVRDRATVVIENEYHIPFAHHFAMEIPTIIARPEGEGVTIVCPIQHPFILRQVTATMLDLPLSAVRVQAVDSGGSFGSKGYPKLEPLAALLALRLDAPVRVALTAEEAFLTAQREASDVRMRTGFDDDGRVVFQEMDADFLVGAYTDISPRVVAKGGLHALTPYRSEASRVTVRGLFTTTPPATAFRGFGGPHTGFAVESQFDLGAHALDLDPLEIRLRNVKHKGDPIPQETPVDGDWGELLMTTAEALGWNDSLPDGHGRGIAVGIKSIVPGTTSKARVHLESDGSVTAYVGTTEMGQGTHATLRRLVADRLRVPLEEVVVRAGDTGQVPYDALTASSRSLVHMGNALLAACDHVRDQLIELARRQRRGDMPTPDDWEEDSFPFRDLLESRAGMGEIVGEGEFRAPRDPDHPLGGPTPFYEVVCTAVELDVDEETGMVALHRIVHTTDAGKILSRRRAAGVDEGGVVMGLGLALSEQLVVDSDTGRFVNASSLDYRIPTVGDVPPMTSLFQEKEDGPGPFGSKGLGEGGILAVAAAIANAIDQSCGVRLVAQPFTPERILRALKERAS